MVLWDLTSLLAIMPSFRKAKKYDDKHILTGFDFILGKSARLGCAWKTYAWDHTRYSTYPRPSAVVLSSRACEYSSGFKAAALTTISYTLSLPQSAPTKSQSRAP
ncbi:hypothetical protein FOMPIDRAFT_1022786 [Fomitopsis schrenkii]|uniref:Uncharacterized protein n=1 Tax=Fomitopsis schrenkii TaxID=2126942 RepID=S8EDV1_FOMSC|nr:hypothetical protein FOMPIDRAFT_1022786 [Fomitopsis schrenkii]